MVTLPQGTHQMNGTVSNQAQAIDFSHAKIPFRAESPKSILAQTTFKVEVDNTRIRKSRFQIPIPL